MGGKNVEGTEREIQKQTDCKRVLIVTTSSCRSGGSESNKTKARIDAHTKGSHRKCRLCKKGHRVTRFHLHVIGIVLVNKHPVGRPRSAEGEWPPTALKCLSWVLLCLLWSWLICLFLFLCVCWLSGVLYSLVELLLSRTSPLGSREG